MKNKAKIYKSNLFYLIWGEPMKIYLIILLTFFLVACSDQNNQDFDEMPIYEDPVDEVQEFCGYSSIDSCNVDIDCMTTGCSGQICHAVISGDVITDCEYKECFNAENFGLRCGCFEGLCAWN